MNRARTATSVQQYFVQAREVQGNVLCLFAPTSPTRRRYRAVLEVTALNFHLKAEEEQAAIIEGYRTLLKSLTFPVQILVRNQRLNLQAYLHDLKDHIPDVEVPGSQWATLTESLCLFLQSLGAERTLLERHFYLVIPAEDARTRSFPFPLVGKRKKQ